MAKEQYYSLKEIDKRNCTYNIIYGLRSNGKTYACLDKILKNYCDHKGTGAVIRRYREDFTGNRGKGLFNAHVKNGLVEKYTDGEWDGVYYYSRAWYLSRINDKGEIEHEDNPFCVAFDLAGAEHDKSSSYTDITTIVFDEFLTRTGYLKDEFVLFMNVISTIIRHREGIKIYMLGNTVTTECPYFKEMGLKHIGESKKGSIEVYTYSDSRLRVAVEYADIPAGRVKGKNNNYYFAFDNPKLKMITNSDWEIGLYPRLGDFRYTKKDIVFIYFIEYEDHLLQCEVIQAENVDITYIHPKTTPLYHRDKDFIFSDKPSVYVNQSYKLTQGKNLKKLITKLCSYYSNEKVFFSDNDTGEIFHNYMLWSDNFSIFEG